MTIIQSDLKRACEELGLEILIPFTLNLPNGKQIQAQALLPQLGAANGIIIVNDYNDIEDVGNELIAMGFGYSELEDRLPNEEFDIDSFRSMFLDWGWKPDLGESAKAPK